MFGKTHFDLNKDRGDIDCVKWENLVCKVPNQDDNNLKVGDVCNFEQIPSTNMAFYVRIFRDTDKDNTNCSKSQSRIN